MSSVARAAPGRPGQSERNGRAESLQALIRSLDRAQTRSLIFEFTAEVVATMFRGNDAKPPTKLLMMADGSRRRANVDDVLEIEQELRALSAVARDAFVALNAAHVVVERAGRRRAHAPSPSSGNVAPNHDAASGAPKPKPH